MLPLHDQLDTDKLRSVINGHHRVLLKVPDGLLSLAMDIAGIVSESGSVPIISADSCYGACDISDDLSTLNVDLIVFIGEAPMTSLADQYPVPAVSFVIQNPYPIEEVINRAIPLLEGTKIGLVSIAPYIHQIETAATLMIKQGLSPLIGKQSRRTGTDGQILGCDLSAGIALADRIDSYLYIGDGMFHPLGLALTTKKPVIVANPAQNKVLREELTEMKNQLLKQRYATITHAMEAKRIGIIVGLKLGQNRIKLAQRLKERAEEKGLTAYYIAANNLQPDRLDYLDVDCYVSTACPRVALDDNPRFAKPLLTPIEFEILLGERSWNEYEFDQIV